MFGTQTEDALKQLVDGNQWAYTYTLESTAPMIPSVQQPGLSYYFWDQGLGASMAFIIDLDTMKIADIFGPFDIDGAIARLKERLN